MSYRRLSLEERIKIEVLWAGGHTAAEIARLLGRPRCTIGRELVRNRIYRFNTSGAVNPRSYRLAPHRRRAYSWRYSARKAQLRAERLATMRRGRRLRKLDAGALRQAVLTGLRARWSPRQIASRLRRQHGGDPSWMVSHETIYQALYMQARGSLRDELRTQVALRSGRSRRRAQPSPAGPVRSNRPWTTGWHISTRPAEANDRAVPGHWEGDLLLGRANRSAIITLVERATRFVLLGALPGGGHDSTAVIDVLSTLIGVLPAQLRRSLAWDNGAELAQAARFRVATDCPVYFADPHSPWQRGSNENTNGLLRQYFPKGRHDFSTTSQTDLDTVAAELNGRPRMTLDWATPAETLNQYLVALEA